MKESDEKKLLKGLLTQFPGESWIRARLARFATPNTPREGVYIRKAVVGFAGDSRRAYVGYAGNLTRRKMTAIAATLRGQGYDPGGKAKDVSVGPPNEVGLSKYWEGESYGWAPVEVLPYSPTTNH